MRQRPGSMRMTSWPPAFLQFYRSRDAINARSDGKDCSHGALSPCRRGKSSLVVFLIYSAGLLGSA